MRKMTTDACMGTDSAGESLNYKMRCKNTSMASYTVYVDKLSCKWGK